MHDAFRSWLQSSELYRAYIYSYPHKTAYRAFPHKVDLRELWQSEKKDALFLYAHLPFCQAKCSFCNLFSLPNPEQDLVQAYLAALERQARAVKEFLGPHRFAGLAIGGGTPSLLSVPQLDRLFSTLAATMELDPCQTRASIELSPDTSDPEKLGFLASRGVERISIGIQSFVESEARSLGRRQNPRMVDSVLTQIAGLGFPVFNIDLIYGIPGQTAQSWLYSLDQALCYHPSEIFLYPLYTRPHTALYRRPAQLDASQDLRGELYRIGRELLLSHGYVQDSLRLFRKPGKRLAPGNDYSCQEDGMVGLGTNARSYTTRLHYATRYAVNRRSITRIIGDYAAQSPGDFSFAEHGIVLSESDRKRRFLIKSLLKVSGLSLKRYLALFQTPLLADFPELAILPQLGLAWLDAERLSLTPEGLARSDLIGEWFISEAVRRLMQEYQPQ